MNDDSAKRYYSFIVVKLLTCVWIFVTPWTVARQASLSFTISQSLFKLMSIESVMPPNHLILFAVTVIIVVSSLSFLAIKIIVNIV